MFGTMRLGFGARAAAAALIAVAATGCGGAGASSALDDTTDGTGTSSASPSPTKSSRASESPGTYEYPLRTFGNAHVSFSFRLGPGEAVGGRTSDATASPSATDPLRLTLTRDGDGVADITSHAADEPLRYPNTGLGNGRPGVYRTAADIPAGEAAAATHVHTVLGEATVFTHPYYECTNSCKQWTVPVAVIALTSPKDPRFPTLVIASNHAELDADELTEVLGRLAS